MGLFSKISHRNDNSAWASTSNSRGAEYEEIDFSVGDSLASQEFMMEEASTVSASFRSGGTNTNTRKEELLERELRHRDDAISQLRQTMEAGERIQSTRIALLEQQLERLVELTSRECARQGKVVTILLGSRQKDRRIDPPPQEDQLEVSALEELLVRVIAEKDRLGFENGNLKSVLKLRNANHSSSQGKMPPTISQLDNMVNEDHKKSCQTLHDCQDDLNSNNQGRAKNNGCLLTPTKELNSVLYQMSCSDCPGDRAHLKYIGACTPTCTMDHKNELTNIMREHFSCVWTIVDQRRCDISSCIHIKDQNEKYDSMFSTSLFARHLVKNCQHLSNEEEVIQWCIDHVKVEIQKTGTKERRISSSKKDQKKKRSKSRRSMKGKKRIENEDACEF